MQNDKQLLVTVGQAAKLLAVSDFTIRRAVWSGRLRSVRLGRSVRLRSDDLQQFIEANTERAGTASGMH